MNADDFILGLSAFLSNFIQTRVGHNSATATSQPGKSSGIEIMSPSLNTTGSAVGV